MTTVFTVSYGSGGREKKAFPATFKTFVTWERGKLIKVAASAPPKVIIAALKSRKRTIFSLIAKTISVMPAIMPKKLATSISTPLPS
jgi:hypothetical protein